MNKVALFLQPFGIGDAIFAKGVANYFMQQGYKILWPVKPAFVDGLNRAYPDITYIPDDVVMPEIFNLKTDHVRDGMRIVPIRWSDAILGRQSKEWMRTKYDLYNLDYKTWVNHAWFKRDTNREHALMRELDLKPGEKYNLVNQIYKSNFAGNVAIDIENGLRNVEMTLRNGYSIFDWSGIIQNATHIHVVNSAIFYLLELLELKAESVHLYARVPDEKGFPYVDYLMTKNYNLHE